ncbi:YczE/YyaS/YitT family protein [Isoptericola variabilis]|uniref:membrane protein YczE n=1 Tax=Isoptericola variabilis TaxID=139208 RepID=UPI003D1DECCD
MSTTARPVRRPSRRLSRRLPRGPLRRQAARSLRPGAPRAASVAMPETAGTTATAAVPAAMPWGPVRRGTQLVLGLLAFTWSMAMMLHAGQGGMPWDVLHQGLVRSTGLGFGTVVALTSVLVLLAWVPLRQRPGIGTVANVAVISLAIGPCLTFTAWLVPDPGPVARIALAVGGIVLNGVATAAYIGVRLGPGPRDGLMTGLVQRSGASVRLVRTGIEVVVVLAGILLGGTFGWATVAFALGVGPVVQATVRWRWLVPTGLTGTVAPAARTARPTPTDADLARRGREISRALDTISREHRDG